MKYTKVYIYISCVCAFIPTNLSASLAIYLSLCLSIYLCLSVCLFVYLSVHLSLYISICPTLSHLSLSLCPLFSLSLSVSLLFHVESRVVQMLESWRPLWASASRTRRSSQDADALPRGHGLDGSVTKWLRGSRSPCWHSGDPS